jgi:nucleobase:cation symporter-1, NCS1 family
VQPWKLLADPKLYIYDWLGGYSGGLAAIAGVMICDYWIIRRQRLNLADLYRKHGRYQYHARFGVNSVAIVATAIGAGLAWSGAFVPRLRFLFDYAWFVGFFVSMLVYYIGMRSAGRSAHAGGETRAAG